LNEKPFGEKQAIIKVEIFKASNKRVTNLSENKCNLYLKELPDLALDQVEAEIR